MLFVFQVDTGRMMTFDMTFALESVVALKAQVEESFKIPSAKQVLLVSGGQHLSVEDRICSYPAGTDTSPIFLFSKAVIESDQPPAASVDYGPETDFAQKVRESATQPATHDTVDKRAQLAKLFVDVCQGQMTTCEKLVHEQHLQQQGWAAVVANLEDLNADLKVRWKLYQEGFCGYIAKRNSYLEFLKHFKNDLYILHKIPLLPTLLESQKIVPDQDDFLNKHSSSGTSDMSLYQWMTQRDDFLDSLFDVCSKGLELTDEREFLDLHAEVDATLAMTEDNTMKEIKGLGDRLSGLESLMHEMKKIVGEQMKISESFQRNLARANEVKEPSVFPDLCATHLQQLNVLLENYNHLRGITRRCIRAKNELSSNLYHRLKWIVYMEDSLLELDNKLVFYYQNLLTLQSQLEILQQVHTAPSLYLSSIVEVVRRRKISQSFLLWASDVACHLLTIYNDEIARRKDFQTQFEGHFLSTLFPGMEDFPPNFATQAPSIYDSNLPKLTEEDVELLRRDLPEMADILQLFDTAPIMNYFMLRDSKDDSDKNIKTVEDKLIEVVNEAGLGSNLDQNILKAIENEPPQTTPHGLPHLKDLDRGCESETDTEEFEKVGQSPFELHFDKGIPSPRPGTQDASTLTEDNLQISRSEYEKLKTCIVKLSHISQQELSRLRSELTTTKDSLLQQKKSAEETIVDLKTSIKKVMAENENREREIIQRLTVDHELEISDFRKIAQSKNEEIKRLRDGNSTLNSELKKTAQDNSHLKQKVVDISDENGRGLEELQKRMEESLAEKEKSIKEVTERLKSEHKSEIESIRARFKLMTMERSPSENSLEKIERGDYPSITNHEALLLQMTENFESEKEVAVSDAINKESLKWQKVLDDRIKQMEDDFQQEKTFILHDVQNRIQEDQDRQNNQLREQMHNLNLECLKYKDTIQQLTDYTKESVNTELLSKIEDLEKDNSLLKAKLDEFRTESTGMAASVAVCEGGGTTDAATSPVKMRKRSEMVSSPRIGKLNIDTCKQGDLVLVVWDIAHQNFKILQESSSLYFLNAECLESLGLRIVDGQPNKLYCYAEVVEKEYCHARKPVNRFRVPQGTKFFRVKARPPSTTKEIPPTHYQPTSTALQSIHMSQSQTTTGTQPAEVVSAAAGPSHSLPSSPSKSNWEKQESQEATIPEEKGEDSDPPSGGERNDEDIEKATELTENFNVDNQSSIDRIEEISCLLLSPQSKNFP